MFVTRNWKPAFDKLCPELAEGKLETLAVGKLAG